MEGFADKPMFFSGDPASMPDPREAKYQLAQRLVDNIRYGEAMRILETLGDYGGSRELLRQVRALRAYQDEEEAKLKAERRRQAAERAMKEARERKRRRAFYIAAGVICLIAFIILK